MANVWTYVDDSDPTNDARGFTLTATSALATVCIDDAPMMASSETVLHLTDVKDAVAVCLFMSADGRSRWEFWAANGGNVNVQQVVNGVVTVGPTALANPHNVTGDIPYSLTVFMTGNTAVVRVDAGDTVASSADNIYMIPNDTLVNYRHWGFQSSVTGARVHDATQYEIQLTESARTEVLVAVCNGELWVCKDPDGELLSLVKVGVTGTGRVGIAEFAGSAYIVGGGKASAYDPITDRVSAWFDAEHTYSATPSDVSTLPGAIQPTATETTGGRGTTGCDIIEVNNDRIFLSGWDLHPEVVFASETSNPNSFRVLNINTGQASGFTVNAQDRVKCLRSLPTNNLLVGCRSSTRMLLGDPLWGQVTMPKIADSGISGAYSAIKSDVGLAVYHSPAGLFQLSPGSILPTDFSSAVLTTGLSIPAADIDSYTINLVRDPAERLLYCFMTPVGDTGVGTHIVYNERGGQYRPGSGFFFPEQYPESVGPTAAVLWRGKVIVGTRNGMLLTFSPDRLEAKDSITATANLPVSSHMFLTMAADSHPVGDTIVTSWRALLADTSGTITAEVWGGATAESLYTTTSQRMLFSTTLEPFAPPVCEQVRSPALALRILNANEVATYWELEQVVGNFEVGRMTATRFVATPTPPPSSSPAKQTPTAPETAPTESTGGISVDGTSVPTDNYGGAGAVSAGVKKA